jgi:hypothetical protein
VWKFLWWCDRQTRMDDVHVSIEFIEINERITCHFLEKMNQET